MLKKILIGVAVVLGLLVLGGLLLPDAYQVSRTVTVNAPLESVQPLLEDLARWPEWSPWEKADTTIVVTLGPVTAGLGASQSWTDKAGGGRLEIVVCQPGRVEYDVWFGKGPAPHRSVMAAVPDAAGGFAVSWTMSGEMDMPVVGPYFKLFADRMMGPMFQQGLDELKRVAELP